MHYKKQILDAIWQSIHDWFVDKNSKQLWRAQQMINRYTKQKICLFCSLNASTFKRFVMFSFSKFNNLFDDQIDCCWWVFETVLTNLSNHQLSCETKYSPTSRNEPVILHWNYGRINNSFHLIRMKWEKLSFRHHFEEICYHFNIFHSNKK